MTTFTVTTLTDENDGGATVESPGGTGLSLREAVALANANAGADDIIFDAALSGTLRLTLGEIFSTDELSIDGGGEITITGDADDDDTVINGVTDLDASGAGDLDDNSRIFITNNSLTLTGLTLTGGHGSNGGGAVSHFGSGTLTLIEIVAAGNRTSEDYGDGGAIFSSGGTLNIQNSVFFGNRTEGATTNGGAIFAQGTTTITNTTIADNSAITTGGGIYAWLGPLTLTNTTITSNIGDAGIRARGALNIEDSIILGNVGPGSYAEINATGGLTTTGMNIIGADATDFDASADPEVVNADPDDVFATTQSNTAGLNTKDGGAVSLDPEGNFIVDLARTTLNPAIDASAGGTIPDEDGRGQQTVDQFSIGNTGDGARDLGATEAPAFATTLDDRLEGTDDADAIDALDGADSVLGLGGTDTLDGSGGEDTLEGGSGKDTLSGGDHADLLLGNGGQDKLLGDNGKDTLEGGGGSDTLKGGDSADMLMAGAGKDTLKGEAGADELFGEGGKDTLKGEDGKDTLIGGASQDILTGGAGKDTFVYNDHSESKDGSGKRDQLTDFDGSGDKIDLSAIDAKEGGGNQDFDFIGKAAFSGTKGELRYKQKSSETIIQADRDGDGDADFEIEIGLVLNLQANDFIL